MRNITRDCGAKHLIISSYKNNLKQRFNSQKKNISTITCSGGSFVIRTTSGGYLDNNSFNISFNVDLLKIVIPVALLLKSLKVYT